jgi:hypothetical protein
MDYRSQTFRKKFESAKSVLKGDSLPDVVSLKFRGNAMPSDYRELIQEQLQHERGLDVVPVSGDFSGQAWLVSLNETGQLVLVEHETGLEVLYIAGSIASLIGLIPLAVGGLRFLRRHFGNGSSHRMMDVVEIRTFDARGSLIEKNVQDLNAYFIAEAKSAFEHNARKIENLEKQVSTLKKQLASKNRELPKKTESANVNKNRPKKKN